MATQPPDTDNAAVARLDGARPGPGGAEADGEAKPRGRGRKPNGGQPELGVVDGGRTDKAGDKRDFGEDLPAPEEGTIVFPKATLLTAPGAAGSATGGAKARVKFEVGSRELGALLLADVIGQRSVQVTFDKLDLGEMAVGPFSGRPDEDGSSRAYLTLLVSQTQIPKLAVVYSRTLFGKGGRLLLAPVQTTLDGALTKRAE